MDKKKEDKKAKKADPKELSNESEKLPKEGLQDSKNLEKGLEKSETSQKEKIKELTETLQRLQAEFENYKKGLTKKKENLLNTQSMN